MKNTPVTEAHYALRREVIFSAPDEGAQLIADSEAKATERANAQVESLISSAKNAIPASEHPAEPTVENWAWQIRNLGDDRRLVYAERDQLRAEVGRLKSARYKYADDPEMVFTDDLGWVHTYVRGEFDDLKARAERAEAELADERARLDWLMAGGVCMVQHAGGFHVSRLHAPVSRAHIDAAMKEGAK